MAKENKDVKESEVKKLQSGMLFSRLNYTVVVKYNGEDAVISPNAKLKVDDISKLQKDLPKGLILRIAK